MQPHPTGRFLPGGSTTCAGNRAVEDMLLMFVCATAAASPPLARIPDGPLLQVHLLLPLLLLLLLARRCRLLVTGCSCNPDAACVPGWLLRVHAGPSCLWRRVHCAVLLARSSTFGSGWLMEAVGGSLLSPS